MSDQEQTKVITVKLRVSPDLRDRIAQSAKAHNRSMNADMVARLEASFEQAEGEAPLGSRMLSQALGEMIEQRLLRVSQQLIARGVDIGTIASAITDDQEAWEQGK